MKHWFLKALDGPLPVLLGEFEHEIAEGFDAGRVTGGADNDKIVVHYRSPIYPRPLVHECLLPRRCVHEHEIDIAVPAEFEGAAGADCYHVNLHAGEVGEDR